MNRLPSLCLSLFCFVSFVACSFGVPYANVSKVEGGEWNKDDVKKFVFTAPDSTSVYELFFMIRNDENYAYSNLFLIASMIDPKGNITTDTLEYEMAKPDGEFLGKGLVIKENKLWYKEKFKFIISQQPYEISVSHAMRKNGSEYGMDMLKGITDVGIIVEKSNK